MVQPQFRAKRRRKLHITVEGGFAACRPNSNWKPPRGMDVAEFERRAHILADNSTCWADVEKRGIYEIVSCKLCRSRSSGEILNGLFVAISHLEDLRRMRDELKDLPDSAFVWRSPLLEVEL